MGSRDVSSHGPISDPHDMRERQLVPGSGCAGRDFVVGFKLSSQGRRRCWKKNDRSRLSAIVCHCWKHVIRSVPRRRPKRRVPTPNFGDNLPSKYACPSACPAGKEGFFPRQHSREITFSPTTLSKWLDLVHATAWLREKLSFGVSFECKSGTIDALASRSFRSCATSSIYIRSGICNVLAPAMCAILISS